MNIDEARAPMPNNPYIFNGSRTGPGSESKTRRVGGRRRKVRKTIRRRYRCRH